MGHGIETCLALNAKCENTVSDIELWTSIITKKD